MNIETIIRNAMMPARLQDAGKLLGEALERNRRAELIEAQYCPHCGKRIK